MFFRNALTAKLLYTKQLLSALPLFRFYKMCYETLFCLSRSFKLVPLAVTSGYILSFAYPPVEKNTDGNLQIKAPRLRVIRRTYSAITLVPTFFFFYCGMGASWWANFDNWFCKTCRGDDKIWGYRNVLGSLVIIQVEWYFHSQIS